MNGGRQVHPSPFHFAIMLSRDAPALGLLADLDKALVHAVLLHQLGMGTALGDAAVVHHQDLIGVLDGSQAMRNGDDRLAPRQFRQSGLNQVLVLRVIAGPHPG